MGLTREQVTHVAELAKLGLTDEEMDQFGDQLSAILEYAEKIQELDTEAIPPTASVLDVQNVMRDDEVRPSMSREDVLANAPDAEAGQFKVRAVLD
ncbi:MAG: Aspartyl/glutamyl-tRNA(Asn/Gln) amidotransferase subunit C [Anaerolineales bacterium]|nr:Aspartyl/glutamyl-tRNA(Asn/Gln) amidotransferase subunit C [Anaerolineales bacterium]